jgi:putative endonuclease
MGADARWHAAAARCRRGGLNRPPPGIVGAAAEEFAARWLAARGADVVLRNYRRRRGELDLVIRHDGVLAIVEVRTRRDARFGGAAASVDARKRRRIWLAAMQLMQARPDLARLPVRFDVLALRPEADGSGFEVEWIRHAFTA